ncbi:hypothetical protein NL676_039580 [Syzygium grande]|nr:hypothetical protein NL676_039580 [Syzygium grande]
MLQEIFSPFETHQSEVLKSICEYLLEDDDDDDSVNAASPAATHADMYSRSLSFSNLSLTESWSQLPLEVDDSEDMLVYGALRDVLNSGWTMPSVSNQELDLEVTTVDYNSISPATEKKPETVEREASRCIPSSLAGEELLRRSRSNKRRRAKFCRSLAALFAGHVILGRPPFVSPLPSFPRSTGSSTEPFVLWAADGTVIKAKMMMERLEEAVVEDMDREQRLVRTVAVRLGLIMQGTYVLGSWWKKGYGCIETYCDNLRVANSMGEGSLVIRDNLFHQQ